MIKDSGNRREFTTGAVRDVAEGRGRCDLLPLKEIGQGYTNSCPEMWRILELIEMNLHETEIHSKYENIEQVIKLFVHLAYNKDFETAFLELAIHYEEGAIKYAPRNWQAGIPTHCFIDSGVRHLLKWKRGDKDENHERAFLWNMFGYLWTISNKPELDDYKMNLEEGSNEMSKMQQ